MTDTSFAQALFATIPSNCYCVFRVFPPTQHLQHRSQRQPIAPIQSKQHLRSCDLSLFDLASYPGFVLVPYNLVATASISELCPAADPSPYARIAQLNASTSLLAYPASLRLFNTFYMPWRPTNRHTTYPTRSLADDLTYLVHEVYPPNDTSWPI